MAEPVKIPTLLKRGRTYSFRRIVPAALRPLVNGKREIVRALNTRDEAEARVLAMQMVGETDRMFAALWTKLKKRSGPPLTPAQAAQVHVENLIASAQDWNLDQWDDENGRELVTDADVDRERIADAIERGTLAKAIKGELDAILLAHKMHVTAAARKDYEEALPKPTSAP